jgi:hypothetical protein
MNWNVVASIIWLIGNFSSKWCPNWGRLNSLTKHIHMLQVWTFETLHIEGSSP